MYKPLTLQVAHAFTHLLGIVTETGHWEVHAEISVLQALQQRAHGGQLCHLQEEIQSSAGNKNVSPITRYCKLACNVVIRSSLLLWRTFLVFPVNDVYI